MSQNWTMVRSGLKSGWTAIWCVAALLCPGAAAPQAPTYTVIDHPAIPPPAGAEFGTSVTTLDFLGLGTVDIAVGAPGENAVYLFLGNWNFDRYVRISPSGLSEGALFGHDVAAANLDGAGGDELIIGAPGQDVAGQAGAGALWVYGRPFFYSPVVITAAIPEAGDGLGVSLSADDFDGDGQIEIAAGAPYKITSTGEVHLFKFDGSTVMEFQNPQGTVHGNFGHDVASTDFNDDGVADLIISALGNHGSTGATRAGQVFVELGPITPSGSSGTITIDGPDTSTEFPTIDQRFGMSVAGSEHFVAIGAHRRDIGSVEDAGQAYLVTQLGTTANFNNAPDPHGLFAFRVAFFDLIGDDRPDLVLAQLNDDQPNGGVHAFDLNDLSNTLQVFPLPYAGDDHWAQGFAGGDVFPGGKDEIVTGGPRYEPPGYPPNHNSGRVVIIGL